MYQHTRQLTYKVFPLLLIYLVPSYVNNPTPLFDSYTPVTDELVNENVEITEVFYNEKPRKLLCGIYTVPPPLLAVYGPLLVN